MWEEYPRASFSHPQNLQDLLGIFYDSGSAWLLIAGHVDQSPSTHFAGFVLISVGQPTNSIPVQLPFRSRSKTPNSHIHVGAHIKPTTFRFSIGQICCFLQRAPHAISRSGTCYPRGPGFYLLGPARLLGHSWIKQKNGEIEKQNKLK